MADDNDTLIILEEIKGLANAAYKLTQDSEDKKEGHHLKQPS